MSARRWKPGRKQREKIARATMTCYPWMPVIKGILLRAYSGDETKAKSMMSFLTMVAPFAESTKRVTRTRRRAL